MIWLLKIFRRQRAIAFQARDNSRLKRLQKKACHFLQIRLDLVNRRWVYGASGVFLLVLCIVSLSAIWNAFNYHEVNIPIHSIKPPHSIGQTDAPGQPETNSVRMGQHVRAFSLYLDSLRQHNYAAYDSIRKTRPGLIDSLHLLQKMIK
jgi:hypothetical protein